MHCGDKRCFRQGEAECRAFDRAFTGKKDRGRHNIKDEWKRGGRNGDIGRANNGKWSHWVGKIEHKIDHDAEHDSSGGGLFGENDGGN